MNREKLRSLAIGFLSSAILLGAYAIFFQGYVPVQGVNINSVMNTKEQSQEVAQYKQEISSLKEENESLAKAQDEKKDPSKDAEASSQSKRIESLESANESLNKQIASLGSDESQASSTSQDEGSDSEAENYEDENYEEPVGSDEDETYYAEEDTYEEAYSEPETSGEFVITSGEGSSQIADQLEAAGFIDSSEEFQDLLAYWELETLLQDGTYQLNSNMSIHEIAEILTNYVYYYIP